MLVTEKIENLYKKIDDLVENFSEEGQAKILEEIEKLKVLYESGSCNIDNNEMLVLTMRAKLSNYKKVGAEWKKKVDKRRKELKIL